MTRLASALAVLAAAVAGAAVMVIEVAGAHVLAPGFGTGLNAWAAMIVVALGGLAVGYALGGVLADRCRQRARWLLAAAMAAAGLGCIADGYLGLPLVDALAPLGPHWGAVAAAACLFGVPLLLLGAVYPLALRIRTQRIEQVGRRAGSLSAVSAVGSVAGAAAAGFVLVPLLAMETVFAATAALLLAAAAAVLLASRGGRIAGAAALLLAAGASFLPARPLPPEILLRRGSLFGPLEVWQSGITRYLMVARTCQGIGRVGEDGSIANGMPHVRIIAATLAADIPPNDGRVLLIGLGAGFLPRELDDVRCLSVEIDPAVVDAAERFFGFDASRHPVRVADGRAFLRTTDERFEAVVLDAFRGTDMPYHLLTREFFQLVRSRLTAAGVLIVNFQGTLAGDGDRLLRAIERTLREVFAEVDLCFHEEARGYGNVLLAAHGPGGRLPWARQPGYLARETFLDARPAAVLTDAQNPVSLWSAELDARRPSPAAQ